MSRSFRIFLYFISTIVISCFFKAKLFPIIVIIGIITGIIMEILIIKFKKKQIIEDEKKCKYCQSLINGKAKICPICKRNQSIANNPLLLIPIIAILTFFTWCLFSNNAPQKAKEIFCGLGIRHGDYCLIETGEFEIKIYINDQGIILQPYNNSYAQMVFTKEQVQELPVKVVGIAVERRTKL